MEDNLLFCGKLKPDIFDVLTLHQFQLIAGVLNRLVLLALMFPALWTQ